MGILFAAPALLYESRMAVRRLRLSVLSLALAAFACSEGDPTPLQPGDASIVGQDHPMTPEVDGGGGPGDGPSEPIDGGQTDSGIFDPLCESCRQDNETCEVSFNCQPGSICNKPGEDFYDPTLPEGVCIRVICTSDTECVAPDVCTARGLCEALPCQADYDCLGDTVCKGGACVATDLATAAAACVILTRSQPISTGTSILLEALVLDANGEALRGPSVVWSSSDATVVRISGDTAIGEMNAGTAVITASVSGNSAVSCGGVELNNLPAIAAGDVRIVALAEDDLSPVDSADVYFGSSSAPVGVTNSSGVMLTSTALAAPTSITVVRNGYHAVTVFITDPTDQLLILIPRAPDRTVAGGVRGKVDISTVPRGDVLMAVGGVARDMNVLGHGVLPAEPDIIRTTINAPELGLNNQLVDLPGNYLVGLGTRQFTADETHCQGLVPEADELGCYLLRAPAGPTTPYIFAGKLRLAQITPIANELSGALGEGSASYRLLLTLMSPIIPFLNHGARPYLEMNEVPRTPEGVPDYANYLPRDMRAEHPQNILALVNTPTFPTHNGICPEAAELTIFSIAHGRGLVPLGVRVAEDVGGSEAPNCRPAPTRKPFGDVSADTAEGVIPIAMAPRHSGLEGGRLLIAISAIDVEVDASNERRQASVFKHVERLSREDAISGQFLPFVRATISRQSASVALSTFNPTAVTGTRITIERGDQKWFIHAAGFPEGTLQLPAIMPLDMLVLDSDRGLVQTYLADATFQELFTLGSGRTFAQLVENIRAVTAEEATIAP